MGGATLIGGMKWNRKVGLSDLVKKGLKRPRLALCRLGQINVLD